MLAFELCAGYSYRTILTSRKLSKCAHDWRSSCTCVNLNLPLPAAGSQFCAIDQNLLQAHLGSLLFGICPIHSHLVKFHMEMEFAMLGRWKECDGGLHAF